MLKLGNKPLIGHIIDNLKLAGITEIIISLHYLPEIITNYVGTQALYFYEPSLLDHASKLRLLKDWIHEEDFLVLNGDTWSNIDYKKMINAHTCGSTTVCMDEWRAVGSWIYCALGNELPVRPYRPVGLKWADIGTPARLKEARKAFL